MTDFAAPDLDLRRTDVFAWLKAQAEALRAREAGRNLIAYDELAEEVDGLAQSVRNRVYSLTARIIEHLYRLVAGELIADAALVTAARPAGYSWAKSPTTTGGRSRW